MTQEQKVIRVKVGVLELAKQLGNVSQACRAMGYSRDSFYRFKELLTRLCVRTGSKELKTLTMMLFGFGNNWGHIRHDNFQNFRMIAELSHICINS